MRSETGSGPRWRITIAPLLAATVVFMAAGCATYAPRPLDAGAVQSRLERRSLTDPLLSQWLAAHAARRNGPWDLDRLAWVALYYNAGLDAARTHWASARAAAITAGARPNPTLELTSEYNRDAAPGEDPWTRGLALAIPIETAGKRRARVAVAVAQAEQARLEFADAAWAARGRVRAALVALLAPAPQLQAQVDAQSGRARLMQRRVELGLAGRPDLTQARLSLQAVQADAADARRELAEGRTSLAAALGVSVAALDAVDVSMTDVEHPLALQRLPDAARQRALLLRRPDLLASLAAYGAAEAALRLEVAKQYPDLSLSPGLLWDAGAAKWTLGLSLVLPLLDRNRGPIAEAGARRDEAAAHVLQVQAGAFAELEQARAGYVAALDAWHAADAQADAAEALVGVAQRALAAGTGIRSDVLGAQAGAASARAHRQRALMQAQVSLGALEDALRMPLEGPPFAAEDVIRVAPPRGGER